MNLLIFYLAGCLMGLGITHTFVIPYKQNKVSNFRMYIYGIIGSWITVVIFIFGVLKGFLGGGDEI